ncbi:SDR family NAD(P)-dependent oxidoreductase [Minwuia sp.]|uniref:SDR family NAD(P)-dependent oxidoreductase n=1 Tax=Minwuia sp. TaxID=2493630 RepID=UPI003A94C247
MTETPTLKRLEGRIALVTGASKGIGRSIARRYAAEGAHVIAVARGTGKLEELDDEISGLGGSATLVPLDLEKWESIDGLAAPLAERFGKLDILVGNAAILGTLTPVQDIDPKEWERAFRINVHANWRLLRALDPLLRRSDAGRVMFVTSGITRRSAPYWGVYATTKAALEKMAETYAAEVQKTNVRVNVINPGATRTGMRASAFPGEDPETLPHPDQIMEAFVAAAEAGFDGHALWIAADETARNAAPGN